MTNMPNLQARCTAFYNREARLLDNWQLEEWLDLLTEDIEYRVPLRVTREIGKDEFGHDSAHLAETKKSLELRIEKANSEYNWSENPPSRIRHFVSNVDVREVDGDEIRVESNLLFFRNKQDETNYDLLSGRREDVLRRADDELLLAERVVYLDTTVLDIEYLSTFL